MLLLLQWPRGSEVLRGKGLRRSVVSPEVAHVKVSVSWILLWLEK